jgi:tetratricopeptide (TPR) repeat protein
MYQSTFLITSIFVTTHIILMQNVASAKSAAQVAEIATAITIEIKTVNSDKCGSGILLQRQGDIYTVLTAAHVVSGDSTFTMKTVDGIVHKSLANSVRKAGKNIDLAIVKFRSAKTYTLAKISTTNSVKVGVLIYVAGFPEASYAIGSGIFNFTEGKVIGNANNGNSRGYSLIYSNVTFRGMSGGPVLNEAGELVAIHGQGDRTGKEGNGEKTGRNLGITVERFGAVAVDMEIQLDQQIVSLPFSQIPNANDYFLSGYDKNEKGDYNGAILDYRKAIEINPDFALAYINLGNIKYEINGDLTGALADYNRAISINPEYSITYSNRANVKSKLRGCLKSQSHASRLSMMRTIAI